MNMKKHFSVAVAILLIVVCIIPLSALAKEKDEYPRAEIKVEYNYHEKFMRGNVEVAERDIPMLLLANSQRSKFYSPETEYKDSLESTPSGSEISHQMLRAAVKAYIENNDESLMNNYAYHTFMYVFKDAAKNEIVVYDKAGLIEYGTYTEDFSELIWEIGDSTKTVMGYECVMATTNYHGRHWTVWFTPEIPLQDGPWKLRGLPGLILEASEPTGQHTFTATGIERTDKEMVPVYTGGQKDYEKMPRKEMLRNLRHSRENGNAIIQAQTGISIGTDAHATEESKKYDYLETDYH